MADYEETIRTRAYRIWEESGRPEGREREHWQRAIAELEGENDVRGHSRAEGLHPGGAGTTPVRSTLGAGSEGANPGSRGPLGPNAALRK